MLLMGAAVAICGVVLIPVDLGAGIVILLTGIGFVLYGIYGLSSVNVRKFISSCGVILDDINDSYMNGKLLTYKKAYSDEYRNCGINIGGKYTVIFTVKEIAALKNFDISDVQHRILRTKYYGNDIYTGARYTHHIDITVRNSDTGNNKTFTVELSEFQAELAAEELRAKLITDNRDKNYNI